MIILIKSIIIGMFAIFPGVSGSALAISLDIYDKFFLSLERYKENAPFIIKVFFGLLIGIIIGSKIIIYLTQYQNILYYIFCGLIIGTIPNLVKKIKKINYLALLLSFSLSTITILFYKNNFIQGASFFNMVLGGILFSFGKIFPGVSSSFFLIILGIYDDILILFSNPYFIINNFFYYFPFIIGVIIGLVLFTKLLNILISKKYDLLFSSLTGFVISSIFSILPKFKLDITNFIGVLLMVISLVISLKFNRKKET